MSLSGPRRLILTALVLSAPLAAATALNIPAATSVGFAQGLTLPFTGTVSSSAPAFQITQSGSGIAGRFSANNTGIALVGVNNGNGYALLASNSGKGHAAVVATFNNLNYQSALDVGSQSLGTFAMGAAADFRSDNTNATGPAVQMSTLASNTVLQVNHKGALGQLAVFQVSGVNKARINHSGKGLFNGGVVTGGADVAEALAVEGRVGDYQPGDVLVVSARSDDRVERVREPYSTRVVGVYATRPGVVLSDRDIDANLDDTVAVGVIGVIPTKVSAENGAIRRGDLLVSAATPGHAMRAAADKLRVGMVIGKALQHFDGPGTGMIRVLVNVK